MDRFFIDWKLSSLLLKPMKNTKKTDAFKILIQTMERFSQEMDLLDEIDDNELFFSLLHQEKRSEWECFE